MAIARYGDVQVARGGIQILTEMLRNKRAASESRRQEENAILLASIENGLFSNADSETPMAEQFRDATTLKLEWGTKGEQSFGSLLNPLVGEQKDVHPSTIGVTEQNNVVDVLNSMLEDNPATEAQKEILFGNLEGADLEFAVRNAIVGVQANKNFKTQAEETAMKVSNLSLNEPAYAAATESISNVRESLRSRIETTKKDDTKEIKIDTKTKISIKDSLRAYAKANNKDIKALWAQIKNDFGLDQSANENDVINRVSEQMLMSSSKGFLDKIYGSPELVSLYQSFHGQSLENSILFASAKNPAAVLARTIIQKTLGPQDGTLMSSYRAMAQYENILQGEQTRQSFQKLHEEAEEIKSYRQQFKKAWQSGI